MAVKISMLVFWDVTLCGPVGSVSTSGLQDGDVSPKQPTSSHGVTTQKINKNCAYFFLFFRIQ
jgi:hypothetical protein